MPLAIASLASQPHSAAPIAFNSVYIACPFANNWPISLGQTSRGLGGVARAMATPPTGKRVWPSTAYRSITVCLRWSWSFLVLDLPTPPPTEEPPVWFFVVRVSYYLGKSATIKRKARMITAFHLQAAWNRSESDLQWVL